MSSDHFLSRWSKRKQAVRRSEQPPEDAPETVRAASEATPEAPALQEETQCAALPETELSADEIAALPSLEELTAETDISVFLRKGVPEPLRKAALRRAWSLDPKIRDFVGDAREYAYDWNTPGGVPGFGPLPATEEVLRMAARIVGAARPDPTLPDSPAATADVRSKNREQPSADRADPSQSSTAGLQEDSAQTVKEGLPSPTADEMNPLVQPSWPGSPAMREARSAQQQLDAEETTKSNSARRHGGAIPL
jgi:hypothetical protein